MIANTCGSPLRAKVCTSAPGVALSGGSSNDPRRRRQAHPCGRPATVDCAGVYCLDANPFNFEELFVSKERLIEFARQVKMPYDFVTGEPLYLEKLEAFASLVRADEREACALLCDEAAEKAFALQSGPEDDLANVFLRHHAVAHQSEAAAIRARSNT